MRALLVYSALAESVCGRMGGRAVEGTRLLSEYGSKAHRGFESLSIRQVACAIKSPSPPTLPKNARNGALSAEKLLTSQAPGRAEIVLSLSFFSKAPDCAKTVWILKPMI